MNAASTPYDLVLEQHELVLEQHDLVLTRRAGRMSVSAARRSRR
jgi:hypothetical protein